MEGNCHITPPVEFYCLLDEQGKLIPIDLCYDRHNDRIWFVRTNHNACPIGKKTVLLPNLEAAAKDFLSRQLSKTAGSPSD